MLARNRFETETPNVIDPGEDIPPPPTYRKTSYSNADSSKGNMALPQGNVENSFGSNLSRHDRNGLYTRNGNKGTISKGMVLRCILNDNSDESSVEETEEDVLVFGDEHNCNEVLFSDEPSIPTSTLHSEKKPIRLDNQKRNSSNNTSREEEEEDSGIAQARLFAAAMLNESEKRQKSHRLLMIPSKQDSASSSTLRKMMKKASSLQSVGLGNSSHHTTFHRYPPHPSNVRSSSPFRKENVTNHHHRQTDNLWLIANDSPITDSVKITHSLSSEFEGWPRSFGKRGLALMLGILLVVGFSLSISFADRGGLGTDGRIPPSALEAIAKDDRLNRIVSHLSRQRISSTKDLYDSTSAQFKAALWMAQKDSEALAISGPIQSSGLELTNESLSVFDFVQRYVLTVFYFALGGETDWKNPHGFVSSNQHECSWYTTTITSDRTEDQDSIGNDLDDGQAHRYSTLGVTCDDRLKVRGIFLSSNNLKGSIPSEIQFLTHLESLNLSKNFLTGTIPEGLRELTDLMELNLGHNFLHGPITPYYWLGDKLTHLRSLDLSYNHLDLQPLFGVDNSNTKRDRQSTGGERSLQKLFLGGNHPTFEMSQTKFLPNEIRYLINLRELSLEDTGIGGNIPSWIFWELGSLRWLNLSDNQFQGNLDSQKSLDDDRDENGSETPMIGLQHLEGLLLHSNELTGTLPEAIGSLPNLTILTLHHNHGLTVGPNAANHICWRDHEYSWPLLESLTTDCGDPSCPCCIENCCNGKECYGDVDWATTNKLNHQQHKDETSDHREDGNE